MSNKIPSAISFSTTIVDFETYFSKFDSTKYDGNLRKWINSGELIEVNNRHFMNKIEWNKKKSWYKTFESLCLSLKYRRSNLGILSLEEWTSVNAKRAPKTERPFGNVSIKEIDFESLNLNMNYLMSDLNLLKLKRNFDLISNPIFFYNSDFFDATCKEIGIDLLFHILMKGIYEQPLMYLDALEKYPDSKNDDEIAVDKIIYSRQKAIYDRIQFHKYKCKELFAPVSSKITTMLFKDKEETLTALSGVFLFVEKQLITLKCADYGFDFMSSPMLVMMLEFLNNIKKYSAFSGGNGSLPNVDKYLNELEENKKKFEYIEQKEVVIPPSKQTNLTGFKSTLKPHQIELLFEKMRGKYIDCSEDDFKAIFSYNPLPMDFSKVEWNDSNRLLAYFIGNCIKITDNKKWKKASTIFGMKNTLQQSLNTNPYPKGFEKLQEIINSIE